MVPVVMKLALLLVAPLLACLGLFALGLSLYGLWIPARRSRRISAELPAVPEKVWQSVSSRDRVTQFGRSIALVTEAAFPPKRLVRRGGDGAFESIWTFDLAPTETGTCLTIVEQSLIRPSLLRGFASLFLDQNAPLKAFLG